MNQQLKDSAFYSGWQAGLQPESDQLISEWADKHRVLTAISSGEAGRYRSRRTPYLIEIMDCLSPACADVELVDFVKPTQIGGTEVANNLIGFIIDQAPGPVLYVLPTLELARLTSEQRITPMIESMPCLSSKVNLTAREAGNKVLLKKFDGGMLRFGGANSAASFRNMPARYLILDDWDGYPISLEGEGDPGTLAVNRTDTFFNRKIFRLSTTTIDGQSRIQKAFEAGDKRYYHVPCPECQEKQVLMWKNLQWVKKPNHRPETAYYACAHCGAVIEEAAKTFLLEQGVWLPTAKPKNPRHRSYHLNALYSPLGWTSWGKIVELFLSAKGDMEELKTWTNTKLAEPWKEQVNDIQTTDISARAEPYPLHSAPAGVLLLTAGVDVQHDRLEVAIYGWGKREEAWLIDWHVIYEDPAEERAWAELDAYLLTAVPSEQGGEFMVEAVAVDSGGHHTHEVYNYCRARKYRQVMAIKGASKRNAPIIGRPSNVDVNYRGGTIRNGCKLWQIGTDTAKHAIYSRLQKTEPGPGSFHFPDTLEQEFYEQLTAEKLTKRYKKGFAVYEWTKPAAARNEALDITVYAYAAALRQGIHRWSDAQWEARANNLLAQKQVSLFDAPVKASESLSSSSGGFKEVKAPW